jgi:uncharacterized protein YqeY
LSIYEGLYSEFSKAKADKDSEKALFLSLIIGEVQNKAATIEDGNKTFHDPDIIKILKSLEKSTNETLAVENLPYDARIKAENELKLLLKFLPKQLTESEIETIMIDSGLKTLPELMKFMKDSYQGRYDGKMASMVCKNILTKEVE